MKQFNIEIGTKLKLESLVYRVEAKNKSEAIKKVKTMGFNSGHRLSSAYSGDFIATNIHEVQG